MAKIWLYLVATAFAIFCIDQGVKIFFVDTNYKYFGEFFSLILTYNKGVAFSMFASLGEWLKYIQIVLIVGIVLYLYFNKEVVKEHFIPIGIILGAGSSNIYDRFIHGGVVDYIFWHKWFEFAVFNLADVMINIAVGIIFIQAFWGKTHKKEIL